MRFRRGFRAFYFVIIFSAVFASLAFASAFTAMDQQFDSRLYQDMRWRCIGPFRGGRTVAATGVPGQPNLFYMAPNNGGLW